MAERNYYVVCDDNCRFEGMTKEQIITAIEQAIETGSVGDIDAGFITKIKETNRNAELKFWVGTQAEYNAISVPSQNTFYIITDSDDERRIINTVVAEIENSLLQNYSKIISGQYNGSQITLTDNRYTLISNLNFVPKAIFINSDSGISYSVLFFRDDDISKICTSDGVYSAVAKLENNSVEFAGSGENPRKAIACEEGVTYTYVILGKGVLNNG